MATGRPERVGNAGRTPAGWLVGLGRALRVNPYELLDDETLVRRARARDHAAFDALAARYRDRLYAMALHALGDERRAGEALCEMMVAAYRDLGAPSAACTPAAWLYLHGLRAVIRRVDPRASRYTVESRTALVAR